ncbi:type I secretion system permease/ATPase [Duganella vulcania]|uniref:Cyclolysin secretion/processing ATP-binding protein CyaB n=1 Tax=Duganella vulcania TaxID=2692166 RepID=A0A845GPV8_9BURK|nr:type I secretion system permease/ATPase [Duganella vulcania]MYM95198.1 type I secretion system permease/ATPase [Duganella vulcania]
MYLNNNEIFEPELVVDQRNTGLDCLVIIAAFHGLPADWTELNHAFGHGTIFTSETIMLGAKRIGLSSKIVSQKPERLHKIALPAIAKDNDGRFFVIGKIVLSSELDNEIQKREIDDGAKILIQRPGEAPQWINYLEFIDEWSGDVLLFSSKANFIGETAKFDFTWFIPSIVKYRTTLAEILLISFVLQGIGLVSPMFFQVIMDKVLVNHAINTLDIISLGLLITTLFEVVLTSIRSYIFSFTSSKIDIELGAKLFNHLLGLPIAYFQARRVGDSVARIKEIENIRSFLTGNGITLVLDVIFSFVFFGVMFLYSPGLTLIVTLSVPLYIIQSAIFIPILRAKLNDKFNRGAENQSFLVETIGGIDTIKSLAVEPHWQRKWERQLAGYVVASLSATNISNVANSGVNLVSKLTTVLIMWIGASYVIEGKVSVGELVAFNMLAGQVSSPILRLAQLWNDFQQVGISMQRLGDILNTRTEIAGQKSRLPRLIGDIKFKNVSFRYRPDLPHVIHDFSFEIRAGEIVGIVGRSGSGKSTLTKLVQRLYVPDGGNVLIDGHDISIIDTASLRHQIGVVLQENNLFSRSIRDNIALSNPSASLDSIVSAAKLSGAHEFICQLPEGYDTHVGEHGAGLSGGQRQRIAIARALINNPRILIFDEATSALDYESERIIQENMKDIARGRTVLIIAHRLSAVRDASRILVMEQGRLAEVGTHAQLLENENGIYTHLYRFQIN